MSKSLIEQGPPVSIRRPAPHQQEDTQETNRWTAQDHAGQKASHTQASTSPEATRPPSHPQDSRVEYR